ncbi:putative quinol monooxygenase [Vibrio sp. TRT 21S02]|uniref:putative quinol monooxygenase n=1 Tax=unclassified Vibrio TaxID=2614977 RepID=UPI00349F11B3
MVHLLAEVKAHNEHIAQVEVLLRGLLEPTRNEKGCCQYELHADSKIPGLFLLQEIWCSQESLDTHMQTEHFQSFKQICEDRDLLEYVQLRPLQFLG